MHRASLPYKSVQLSNIPVSHTATPADCSIEENTSNHRLLEHMQHFTAFLKRPTFPEEKELALCSIYSRVSTKKTMKEL